ncbi:glycosyltransferase family 39 protein [bacterium]|nr:glycosyltransferase family 39 protein [bacterium]
MKKPYLLVLVICSLVLRFIFILRTPITWDPSSTEVQAFNDEPAHVNYVRYLMEKGSLPVQKHHAQEKDAFIINQFEYYQPPLAYIATGLLARIVSVSSQSHALTYFCRIVICITGITGIVLFFHLSLKIFSMKLGFYLTLLYAFLPVHWRHTSSFSNDAFLWIFMILLLFIIRKKWHHSYQIRDCLVEGCLMGLGLWTKSSMMTVVAAYLVLSIFDRKHRKHWILPAVFGLVIASPYFIRNYLLYHEVFGLHSSHGPVQEALNTLSPEILSRFIRGFLITFAFPFDTLDIPIYIKLPAYLLWAFIFSVFIIQFLGCNIHTIKNHCLTLHGILSIIVISTAVSVIIYNWKYLQTEFRNIFYIMPMLLIMAGQYLLKRDHLRWFWFLLISEFYPLILVLCKIF